MQNATNCKTRQMCPNTSNGHADQWNMYTCDGVVKAVEKHGPC